MLQFIFICILLFPFISVLISLFFPKKKLSSNPKVETDFGIIITAYKETEICIPLVESLLYQNYTNYKIYLVADECDVSKFNFNSDKVKILEPEIKLGSKVKSILYAIKNFEYKHSAIIIFDPDNLAHPLFLNKMNKYFQNGYKAVQGRRVAKNLDSFYACLDAMSEHYYNYTTKYVPFKINSSSTIAGSGMGIEYDLYLKNLNSYSQSISDGKVIVAEDKDLQAHLVSEGIKIAFASDAFIFDEKVATASQVERQRTRWINSYFLYARTAIGLMFKGIISLNWNRFYFGINSASPPLFIQILISIFFITLNAILLNSFAYVWITALILFALNILFVLMLTKVEKQIWKALPAIPLFMFNQILALIRRKRSNKEFMETAHTKFLSINDVLGYDTKNKKIRILETIRQGNFGGGETYLYNLVSNLDKEKYEPIVLSFTDGEMIKKLNEIGIKTYIIITHTPFNFFVYRKVSEIIKNENIDFVHIHGTRACSNTLMPARNLDKKTIYTIHGYSFHPGLNKIKYALRKFSEKFLIKRSDVVICGSKNDIQTAREMVPKGRFELIYNSINTEEYKPFPDLTYKRKLGFQDDDFVICFMARFTFQKDPKTFISSIPMVKKNEKIKFLMIGDGELKAECINLAKKLNIEDKITFSTFTSEVKEVLNSVDIFVLQSYWEVVPLGLLEAMSMKRFCIGSNIGGTDEAIVDNHNGFLIPVNNSEVLADKINYIYDNQINLGFIKENARQTVIEKFNLKNLIKENESIYNELYKS
ncbi:MAG TPA: glycosyltransferase [Ignavibacteria bacterium]|nr:glycosyltransferase [Ignavibacteria bacterium]